MPEKKTATITTSVSAEKMQQSISEQLHTALLTLKEHLGEKKFEKRIHKAVKMLVKGIKERSLDKPSKPAKKKEAAPVEKTAVTIKKSSVIKKSTPAAKKAIKKAITK
jgi:hypothetical protein